jgi:hypothetical protein
MKVQRAKVYLTNGEVADIKLLTRNINHWIDGVSANGIKTSEQYIPHHSIMYILIEQTEEEGGEDDDYKDLKYPEDTQYPELTRNY